MYVPVSWLGGKAALLSFIRDFSKGYMYYICVGRGVLATNKNGEHTMPLYVWRG